MSTASQELIKLFDLGKLAPSVFFRSLKEIKESTEPHPYSHLMRRAWESMGLNGILCVDRIPTVYFKEVKRINSSQLRDLQRRLWNQGTATMLVVSSPKAVEVYSGLAYPAREGEEVKDDNRLVEILDRTADALKISQFPQRVETGQIYREKPESFNSEHTVDRYLLEHLEATRDKLSKHGKKLKHKTIHTLLGKIIFTCYLTDRKIINGRQFEEAGAPGIGNLRELLNEYHSPDDAKRILTRLFRQLQGYFNGSMFDETDLTLSDEHIDILREFLNGEEIASGQRTFNFWVYDFSVIPIETISAIYESFLAAESPDGQRQSGAYYTPKHLAEMVIDTAVEGWDSLLGKRFLDPSCGSGIFLVILFNRLAEEWRRKNPGKRRLARANALIEILQTHLYGVDLHETSCRITCFSLYLALLDQLNPRDVQELQECRGKVLPNLLALQGSSRKPKEPPVVVEGNFFDLEVSIPKSFDLVIGNPPWIGRGQRPDNHAMDWCLNRGTSLFSNVPSKVQERKQYFMPENQVAHAFMWKTPTHLNSQGRCCLLLPTKVLLNKTTDRFQTGWFSNFSIEKAIQLSDMRFILFENAICPAVIIRFTTSKPSSTEYRFDYDVPKVDRHDPRAGVVAILPQDRKQIILRELIAYSERNEAPILWKKGLWGGPRDRELLERLFSLPRLDEIVGTPKNPKTWVRGQGFKPFQQEKYDKDKEGYGEPKSTDWPKDHLIINARNPEISWVLSPSDCGQVGTKFRKLHRSPDERIFQPPMVIVNQGFSKKAYCDFPVVFQHALQSISGPRKDANLLMFLVAYLNSDLASYYLFHTAANWGTERDKVHLFELMRLPFPFPDQTHDPGRSREIIQEVAKGFDKLKKKKGNSVLGRENLIAEAKQTMEPLVDEYFDISDRERILVKDTINVFEPSSTPLSLTSHIPTLELVDREERKIYVDLLCDVLNSWAKRSTFRLSGSSIVSTLLGVCVVTLTKSKRQEAYSESKAPEKLLNTLRKIQKTLPKSNGHFSYLRGLKVFDSDNLHIVKLLTFRHWTRTEALNDADEIAAAILSSRKEN